MPANLVPVNMDVEQEAEHIATTPLAILPTLASKGTPRRTKRGSVDPSGKPLGPPFDAALRQEDPRSLVVLETIILDDVNADSRAKISRN